MNDKETGSTVDIERLLTELGVLTGPVGEVPDDTSIADRFLTVIQNTEASADWTAFSPQAFPRTLLSLIG
jgi:hypothetical protein